MKQAIKTYVQRQTKVKINKLALFKININEYNINLI